VEKGRKRRKRVIPRAHLPEVGSRAHLLKVGNGATFLRRRTGPTSLRWKTGPTSLGWEPAGTWGQHRPPQREARRVGDAPYGGALRRKQ